MSCACTPLSYAGLHVTIIINNNVLHVGKMLIDPNDYSHGECMTILIQDTSQIKAGFKLITYKIRLGLKKALFILSS